MSSSFPLVMSVLGFSKSDYIDEDNMHYEKHFTRYHCSSRNKNKNGTIEKKHTALNSDKDVASSNHEVDDIPRKLSENYKGCDVGYGKTTSNGELLLFDLNVTARQLLPNVVVAKAMNTSGSSTLLYESGYAITIT